MSKDYVHVRAGLLTPLASIQCKPDVTRADVTPFKPPQLSMDVHYAYLLC